MSLYEVLDIHTKVNSTTGSGPRSKWSSESSSVLCQTCGYMVSDSCAVLRQSMLQHGGESGRMGKNGRMDSWKHG